MKVFCVEMFHPEGAETYVICKTKELAIKWIENNETGYKKVIDKKRPTLVYYQCQTYHEHIIQIIEREVIES